MPFTQFEQYRYIRKRWMGICLMAILSVASCLQTPNENADPLLLSIAQKKKAFPALQSFDNDEILLGRQLFFDKSLSANGTKSCASCHHPALSFTDGYRKTLGIKADIAMRNTPSLLNMKDNHFFNWADSSLHSIEQQMEGPLFGQHPVEMGMHFQDEATQQKSIKAIAVFIRFIVSYQSAYDLHLQTKTAMDSLAMQGKQLFFSDALKCAQCHGGENFNQPLEEADQFANIGLYNFANAKSIIDSGLAFVTHHANDVGKMRIPSLRNVALTAPYMHDGSVATLKEVITHYARGGRKLDYGEIQGDGLLQKNKNTKIAGFKITEQETNTLIRFLETLTDTSILHDPLYAFPDQK
jgi:cytochrome c peroxidase